MIDVAHKSARGQQSDVDGHFLNLFKEDGCVISPAGADPADGLVPTPPGQPRWAPVTRPWYFGQCVGQN